MNNDKKLKLAQVKKELAEKRGDEFNKALNEIKQAIENLEFPEPPPQKDLEPKLNELNESIIKLASSFGEVTVKNFPEIKNFPEVKPLKLPKWMNKPPEFDDTSIVKSLESNLKVLNKLLAIQKEPTSQKPEDFVPYRRVIKQGNRLIFDDTPIGLGGGGGGSSSGGSIDTSALATSVNQTNGSQKTKITDGTDTLEISPNGGAYTTSVPLATRLDDTTTTNVTYIGKAAIGTATSAASWQIFKIDETTGLVITWADSNANFDNVWDNRSSLTYG